MERTGERRIDILIEEFSGHVEYLRDPALSRGKCSYISLQFERFVRDRDPSLDIDVIARPVEEFGYQDRPIGGFSTHVVVIIVTSKQYMIDFTAPQYGYVELPMVQRRNGTGHWQRQWRKESQEEVVQVTCRAQVSPQCEHGKELADSEYRAHATTPTDEAIMLVAMQQDCTYDGESVICSSCFMVIGCPTGPMGEGRAAAVAAMDEAVARYKSAQSDLPPAA